MKLTAFFFLSTFLTLNLATAGPVSSPHGVSSTTEPARSVFNRARPTFVRPEDLQLVPLGPQLKYDTKHPVTSTILRGEDQIITDTRAKDLCAHLEHAGCGIVEEGRIKMMPWRAGIQRDDGDFSRDKIRGMRKRPSTSNVTHIYYAKVSGLVPRLKDSKEVDVYPDGEIHLVRPGPLDFKGQWPSRWGMKRPPPLSPFKPPERDSEVA